jgi:hypothetical protein
MKKKKRIPNVCSLLSIRPLKGGSYYPKVPTMSVYSKENPGQLIKWGHSAKKFMLKPQAAKENLLLCNFKLNLDETLKRCLAQNLN